MVNRILIAALLVFFASIAKGQGPTPQQAAAFIGTWVFDMTEPPNSKETIRIWDDGGKVAASVQVMQFPSRNVTGIIKDGDLLVLTVSHDADPPFVENGIPIWGIITLTVDGDTMKLAQLMELSYTVKRGTAKRTR